MTAQWSERATSPGSGERRRWSRMGGGGEMDRDQRDGARRSTDREGHTQTGGRNMHTHNTTRERQGRMRDRERGEPKTRQTD